MLRLEGLLERYYLRSHPLGVALFHSALASPVSAGNSCRFAYAELGTFGGLVQSHREQAGVSLFGASLEGGYTLVAVCPYQLVNFSVPWCLFVRLATVVALVLSGRLSPPPGLPPAGSYVLRPLSPTSPAPLQAKAPLPEEPA